MALSPEQLEQIRNELLRALQRLERGTYGICAGCEQPIPYERLLVFPETLRCASCGGEA